MEDSIVFTRIAGACLGLALLVTPALAPSAAMIDDTPFDVSGDRPQAPYGDKVGPAFTNYLRASPFIGTAGVIGEGGFAEAKALGFKTVINLNTAEEGAEQERVAVEAAGLGYISLEVSTKAPTPEQVQSFAAAVADAGNYPILVHCESANRVGAMWALYRAGQGVPAEIAIQEGRTVGLKPSREPAVREQLGLTPTQ